MQLEEILLYKMELIFFCVLICIYSEQIASSNTNFEVKQFRLCNNTQGVIKYHGNITKERGEQYLSHEVVTPVEWGENLGLICLIESQITEKNSVELFTIKEKNICRAAKTYLGEFWYDILRAEGAYNPKSCPQPAGRYQLHHLKLDFNKISLQTFPFGTLKFTLNVIDNKNPQTYMMCLTVVVDNKIN